MEGRGSCEPAVAWLNAEGDRLGSLSTAMAGEDGGRGRLRLSWWKGDGLRDPGFGLA